MENLSAAPDTTDGNYSTNGGNHYDSEGLGKFPESGCEETGQGNDKDVREETEAEELTVYPQAWRPDGTKESWEGCEGDQEELESACPI